MKKIYDTDMQRLGVITLLCLIGFGFWTCAECDPSPSLPRDISLAFFTRDSLDEIVELDTSFYMIFGARVDPSLQNLGGELALGEFDILVRSDSLLSSLDTIQPIGLPVDFREDTVAYIFVQRLENDSIPITGIDITNFDIESRRFDTLIFSYNSNLVIIGPDCGFIEAITDLSLIKNTFDSTVIRNSEIVTDSINVEIYL